MENKFLSFVYTLFLGVLLTVFVSLGISAFYPAPTPPEYPLGRTYTVDKPPTADEEAQQKAYDQQYEAYEKERQTYDRNVSIIALLAAVALLAISIPIERRVRVIADGVMAGGLFVLVYSAAYGLSSDDDRFVFGAITIGLIAVLYIGYHRFAAVMASASPKKGGRKSKK